jgi:hypothetical protein
MSPRAHSDTETALYRREALEWVRRRAYGAPVVVRRPAAWWCLPPLCGLVILVVLAAALDTPAFEFSRAPTAEDTARSPSPALPRALRDPP